MKIHVLKTWPEYFDCVADGSKKFEIRRNDRDYQLGDILVLLRFDPKTNQLTDDEGLMCKVSYITEPGCPFLLEGFVAMGLSIPSRGDEVQKACAAAYEFMAKFKAGK